MAFSGTSEAAIDVSDVAGDDEDAWRPRAANAEPRFPTRFSSSPLPPTSSPRHPSPPRHPQHPTTPTRGSPRPSRAPQSPAGALKTRQLITRVPMHPRARNAPHTTPTPQERWWGPPMRSLGWIGVVERDRRGPGARGDVRYVLQSLLCILTVFFRFLGLCTAATHNECSLRAITPFRSIISISPASRASSPSLA